MAGGGSVKGMRNHMAVPVRLILQLGRLRHLTQEQAAVHLGIPLAEVEEACRVGSILLHFEADPPRQGLSAAEREANLARMPKRFQDRMNAKART